MFNHLLTFLEPHKGEFRTFSIQEALTLTMSHIRNDAKFSMLEAIVNKDRNHHVDFHTISRTIRKVVYILTGESPYKKDTDEDLNLNENQANQKCFYKGDSFKRLRKSACGTFYNQNVGWNAHRIRKILSEGVSAFDKCRQMDYFELQDLRDMSETGML